MSDTLCNVRFWTKVTTGNATECWLWTASRSVDGYGWYWHSGRMQRAHRVAFELAGGLIPNGLDVLHRCDNPPCVNPAHLFLGTRADNNRDRAAKGRSNRNLRPAIDASTAARLAKTHCPQGHEYNDTNTYLSPTGCRKCRACHRAEESRRRRVRR